MVEDKPKIWDQSDMNQSVLNKASSDKFQLIISVPEVLKTINTNNDRSNELINLDSLQFSCINATVPAQIVKKIDLGFKGQKVPVTSYTRDAQPEVSLDFVVDNNFNNYHFLWTWIDGLNNCKESIPTKDYYSIQSQFNESIKMRLADTKSSVDEPKQINVMESKYKNSFFDYQTTMTLLVLREYNEPIARFKYTNAFITELGELKLDYKEPKQLSCSFKFAFGQEYFELLKVNPTAPKER